MLYDLIVIGGGPAGLSAAVTAKKNGLQNVLIIERDKELAGILNQCIHNGFGLSVFKEELTGPEFAGRYIEKVKELGIDYLLDTMVLKLNKDKEVHIVNANGYQILKTKSIIIACGCRERSRGAIGTPGVRYAGVYSAGAAQKYLNIDGYLVGKRVVILGSGDIGLIMARRMTLEGAKVLACIEINPFSSGLQRNIQQCLNDFNIPLYLSQTVVDVKGKDRVSEVVMAKVDEHFQPIPGTEVTFECDTLLLSVGLIPENELSKDADIALDPKTRGPYVYENMETSIPGIFACGNVVQVHDLEDNVALEAERAAMGAVNYVLGKTSEAYIEVKENRPMVYCVPQKIHKDLNAKFVTCMFRVNQVIDNKAFVFRNEKGEKLGSQKTGYLGNGEMVKLIVKKDIIDACDTALNISVEEVDA